MPFLTAAGHRLEYRWCGPSASEAPSLVFLHEGLGSVSMWRDVPDALAAATGCGALVYSRWGHGTSDPLTEPRTVDFMHREARVTLPEVLRHFGIERPVLIGHSDGGSIALIHAASNLGPVAGLALEAPHVFVEDLSVASIARICRSFDTSALPGQLARHHGHNTESMFRAWCDVWLSSGFRSWDITALLPSIRCPVLVIQGDRDEYGTRAQVDAIVRGVTGPVEDLWLPGCGHSPHRDEPTVVLSALARFVGRVLGMPDLT